MGGVGIGTVLEIMKKNPAFTSKCIKTISHSNSHSYLSTPVAATASAASALAFFPNYPSFASQFLFSGAGLVYADAAAGQDDSVYSSLNIYDDYTKPTSSSSSSSTYTYTDPNGVKTYNIELKPLFSAFGVRTLGWTALRSLLIFYLPLVEPYFEEGNDEDEDEFEDARQEQPPVDLVAPLKKSVNQIFRESAVLTTRRVLERLAVHYVSQRMAWKLLKDVPKSAVRKSGRHMPHYQFFFCVSRSTFRGHLLGIAASWIVQVGIDLYNYITSIWKDDSQGNKDDQIQRFKKRVAGCTIRCGASLVCASIGAGLGATLFRPSSGQWIGCAVGDLAGPFVVGFLMPNLAN